MEKLFLQARKTRMLEFLAISAVLTAQILIQWRVWITQDLIPVHDTLRHFPIWAYFADCIQQGIVPLWDPYLESGQPFFIVSPGMVHSWQPWSIILVFLGKLTGTMLLNLYLYNMLIMHLIFTCGCYFLFKHLTSSRIAAFSGFAGIAFSSLHISYLWQFSFVFASFSFPWVMLFSLKFAKDKAPVYLILTAFSLGMAAQCYRVLYTVTGFTIFWITMAACRSIKLPGLNAIWQYKKTLLASLFILTLLMLKIAAQALCLDDMLLVQRMDVYKSSCLTPADIILLFAPYYAVSSNYMIIDLFFSEVVMYLGMIPVFLALIGMVFSRHEYKRPMLITSLLMFLLALGPNSPAFAFLKYIPSLLIIRHTADFHIFLLVFMALFSCLGVDVIARLDHDKAPDKLIERICRIGFVCVCCCALAITIPNLPNFHHAGLSDRIRIFSMETLANIANIAWFALGLVISIWLLKYRKITAALVILGFFALTDLFAFNYLWLDHYTQPASNLPQQALVSSLSAHKYDAIRSPHVGHKHFMNLPALIRRPSAYHLQKKYGSHFIEPTAFNDFMDLENKDIMDIAAGVSAPKTYLVDHAIVLERDAIKKRMNEADPRAFRSLVFIEEPLPEKFKELTSQRGETGRTNAYIRIGHFDPNRCHMEVFCEKKCFLYYSDGYDKAWQAFVDDKEAHIYRANLAFKALPLDEGKHEIRFVYDPKFYKITLFLYFAGLVLGAGLIIGIFFQARRSRLTSTR
ncbi:YfhO family protein [Elusimicrobiota bacterium]